MKKIAYLIIATLSFFSCGGDDEIKTSSSECFAIIDNSIIYRDIRAN